MKLDLHYNGEWLGVEISTKDLPMSNHDNGADDAKGFRATVVEELIAASVLCQVVGELLAFQVSARSARRTTGIDAEELLAVLRSTYRQDGREVLVDENARLTDELNDARVALSDALAERDAARAGSEPVTGEGAGEVGGGGGSEPPLPPPTLGTSDGLPESWKWENVTSVPGPLLLAGMVAPLITESPLMDDELPEAEQKILADLADGIEERLLGADPDGIPLDSQGLPAGYRCDLCARVLATQAGKARHMTVAHQAKALTRDQVERQAALASGDPGGYVKRDPDDEPVGADGLVGCGIGDCTARRSAAVIDRHRLSMHGQ